MVRNLRNIFHRLGLTEQDIRTLRGAIVALEFGRGAARDALKAALKRREKWDAPGTRDSPAGNPDELD
jgi:tRNA/rRNA methyltransferase